MWGNRFVVAAVAVGLTAGAADAQFGPQRPWGGAPDPLGRPDPFGFNPPGRRVGPVVPQVPRVGPNGRREDEEQRRYTPHLHHFAHAVPHSPPRPETHLPAKVSGAWGTRIKGFGVVGGLAAVWGVLTSVFRRR